MNSLERMEKAMRLGKPDRVPLMCQPSWGFVLKQNPDIDPVDLWHNHNDAYPKAFCNISKRFHFDGALIPGIGLRSLKQQEVVDIDKKENEDVVVEFIDGDTCTYCRDDLPRYSHKKNPEVNIEEFDPDSISEKLEYHPVSTRLRMWMQNTPEGRVAEIRKAREIMGDDYSIHGSVYSPEDYLIDLLGTEEAMMAMLAWPDKCKEILSRFAIAVAGHLQEQIDAGIHAVNTSAPWAGQNFISLDIYETIIAPAQKILVDVCRKNDIPCYCHTCGAINDRLELIVDVGFDGLECLDPPPLGNVKLEEAVNRIGDRAFIKGNIDPVNMLMNGTIDEIKEDVIKRLEIGMKAKGFILSTACSIAPETPPANVDVLYEMIDKYGVYR